MASLATVLVKFPIEVMANRWCFLILSDPSSVGLTADVGSMAIRLDGSLAGRQYVKTGAGDTAWTLSVDPTTRVDNGTKSAPFSLDFAAGLAQRFILGASTTITLTNGVAGAIHVVEVVQDSGGSKAPTFSPVPSGTIPTWSTVGNRRDVMALYFDGTTWSVTWSTVNV